MTDAPSRLRLSAKQESANLSRVAFARTAYRTLATPLSPIEHHCIIPIGCRLCGAWERQCSPFFHPAVYAASVATLGVKSGAGIAVPLKISINYM